MIQYRTYAEPVQSSVAPRDIGGEWTHQKAARPVGFHPDLTGHRHVSRSQSVQKSSEKFMSRKIGSGI
jgi:hypothetical protein